MIKLKNKDGLIVICKSVKKRDMFIAHGFFVVEETKSKTKSASKK